LIPITVKPWPLPRPENTKEKYQAGLYFGTVVEKFGEACGVVIFLGLFNVWGSFSFFLSQLFNPWLFVSLLNLSIFLTKYSTGQECAAGARTIRRFRPIRESELKHNICREALVGF
jgi:hypothetical protein